MVMNYAIFDTNLHMIHHYRRLNSAKSVVNSSTPESYSKHKIPWNTSLSSRYSTPSSFSNDRVPSRTNSSCEVRWSQRCCTQKNGRSLSLPPRPHTRRNFNAVPQNFLRKPEDAKQKLEYKSKKYVTSKPEYLSAAAKANAPPARTTELPSSSKPKLKLKKPIPTPRKVQNKSVATEYEYLQFSLRITEDIIRNDLYTPTEMRRVFNSHVEANRGRLELEKMLQHIDHLCKELNISKKTDRPSKDVDKYRNVLPCDKTSCEERFTRKQYLKDIAEGKQVLSDEDVKNLSEEDLQNVLTEMITENVAEKEIVFDIDLNSKNGQDIDAKSSSKEQLTTSSEEAVSEKVSSSTSKERTDSSEEESGKSSEEITVSSKETKEEIASILEMEDVYKNTNVLSDDQEDLETSLEEITSHKSAEESAMEVFEKILDLLPEEETITKKFSPVSSPKKVMVEAVPEIRKEPTRSLEESLNLREVLDNVACICKEKPKLLSKAEEILKSVLSDLNSPETEIILKKALEPSKDSDTQKVREDIENQTQSGKSSKDSSMANEQLVSVKDLDGTKEEPCTSLKKDDTSSGKTAKTKPPSTDFISTINKISEENAKILSKPPHTESPRTYIDKYAVKSPKAQGVLKTLLLNPSPVVQDFIFTQTTDTILKVDPDTLSEGEIAVKQNQLKDPTKYVDKQKNKVLDQLKKYEHVLPETNRLQQQNVTHITINNYEIKSPYNKMPVSGITYTVNLSTSTQTGNVSQLQDRKRSRNADLSEGEITQLMSSYDTESENKYFPSN